MPQKIAAGNWKMNGTRANLDQAAAIASADPGQCRVVLCPPATLLAPMAGVVGDQAFLGGQDCHANPSGAHTGDISAPMLADAGASHVILGHSERRADHGETSEAIAAKVAAAWKSGLVAILCIGETEEERDAERTLDVVLGQLASSLPDGATPENTIVAYEPVWAIGTGRTATPVEIAEVHDALRANLEQRFAASGAEISLLYGGSVKAGNAAEIFAVTHVNGALVGGASLRSEDFVPIIDALSAS